MTSRHRVLGVVFLFAVALVLPGGAAVADEPPKGAPAKATPEWECKSVRVSFAATTGDRDKTFDVLREAG
jgi:hypothetical protein